MLDMKWVRAHAEEVQAAADGKKIKVDIAVLIQRDNERKALLQQTEEGRRLRNTLSAEIGKLMQTGEREQAETMRAQVKQLNDELEQKEAELALIQEEVTRLQWLVPNVVSPDTPAGLSDEDNVELRRVGELPEFDYAAKDHVELGELHGLIDIPRGVKIGGTRSYVLKGAGLLLHRAVQQLALDLLLRHGFTPLEVPLMVREDALVNTGFFPTGRDQVYELQGENKWLVGTSEVPLVSYYADEVIDVKEPVKLAAVSTCFRSEVGSGGRDVRGLYRVHQFAKVEQVILCAPDAAESERMLQEITGHAEELLQQLEMPYRVVAVCTGDMSQKTYKQYDIETWMPSRGAYGETHSSSNLHDFQARRSNIRCLDEQGKLVYCHTLNNTAVASPRILIPLLENHQQADGSIHIPKALRPYMGGLDRLVLPVCEQGEEQKEEI
ncbi:serine--tRNA ligase [Paenibacillus silvae]|uniref:serine--tRNA ligase n=1 Tax=Paenibacillus silvae TaxID=1325358 RepID=UPI002003C63E|nr:serine--tRNA ligase [Paenibacillus silvae]MCK6077149.1 serine--tRNA ligase [Paenibacillus silvae]MCK6151346.1 serine--tRNA ligase [Paenibacillus silvae]MCK6269835.1 serine--tRNA ligase [Paenibacillus silvae]